MVEANPRNKEQEWDTTIWVKVRRWEGKEGSSEVRKARIERVYKEGRQSKAGRDNKMERTRERNRKARGVRKI